MGAVMHRSHNSHAILIVLFASLLQPYGWTQSRPSGGSTSGGTPSTGTSTAPATTNAPPVRTIPQPNTFPSQDFSRPIFLRGKVVLDQGGELTEPVPIQRVCGSVAHREGYTDSQGNFSFQVGDSATTFQDASESGLPGGRQQRINTRQLWNCELRAVLPGYQSSVITLAGRDFSDMSPVGNIVLTRIGGVEGNSISVTSLKAPGKAKNEYRKALESYDQKKYSDAEKHLAKALDIYPEYASAWELRGREQQQQHQIDEAIKSFQAAIAADNKLVGPYVKLAYLQAGKGDWAEVLRLSDRALQLDPKSYPDAYMLNGAANYNLKKYPEAERSAAKAVELDKEGRFPRTHLLLGTLFQIRGNNAAAAEHFRTFLKLEPNAPEAQQITSFLSKYDQASAAAPPVATPEKR